MYLRDLLASLGRRWYLLLVGVLVTGGVAALAYEAVPASYDAKASMVLLPPKSSVTDEGNPYLYLSGLGQALDILSRKLDSDAIREPLEDEYPGSEYLAVPDNTTSGPILSIEVSASSASAARTVMNEVIQAVPVSLESLQSELEVPQEARITSMVITADRKATPNHKMMIQAVLAVVAAGIAGTVLLTGFIDGRLVARRERLAGTPKPLRRSRKNNDVSSEDVRDSDATESVTAGGLTVGPGEELSGRSAEPVLTGRARDRDSPRSLSSLQR